MKKALILVVLLLTVFVGEMLMFENNTHAQDKEPYIAVTSFPLYEIAKELVDNKIEVKKLIPFGVEAHTYTPSVRTMTGLTQAKRFVYNGLGLEPWIKKEYSNGMNMSSFVQLQEHQESEEEEHHHDDEESDPHYWLDIENMIRMTAALAEKLSEDFPEHKSMFERNSKTYIKTLRELKEEYAQRLKSCKRREIVVNHNAFGYLGHEHGFASHSVTGLSPDEQASAKRMKEITDLVRDEGIKTVFFESFVSPKVATAISKETGAQAQSLQPLANVNEKEAAKGYIALMQENLEKLAAAMECE